MYILDFQERIFHSKSQQHITIAWQSDIPELEKNWSHKHILCLEVLTTMSESVKKEYKHYKHYKHLFIS